MRKPFSNKQLALIIGALIFLAISAFFMVNVELPPWSHWLSGLNVVLFAIPAFWATRRWLGWRDAFLLWGVLGVYALLIETLAIHTGFPYGHFGYSELLGAKLFGTTPWTVFLAWTPIILGSYVLGTYSLRGVIGRVVGTAIFATVLDMVLDPGAVKLGFWQYADRSWWYDVPWSNFGGWLVTCAVAALLIEGFLSVRKPLLPVPVQMASSLFFIGAFWSFVSVFSLYWLSAALGFLLVAGLDPLWRRHGYHFDEMLVLCDESGKPVGTMRKADVHTNDTPLHRAFSIFIFNSKGELLLQQRAMAKVTWPDVWSNSCCGHVMLNETDLAAAKRRLKFELGMSGIELTCILPDFRYRAEKDGVVENEICPVFVGFTDREPISNADEIAEVRWQPWSEVLTAIKSGETELSPWAVEEAELLEQNDEFREMYESKQR